MGGQINRNNLLLNISLLPESEIYKLKKRMKTEFATKPSKLVEPFGREKGFNEERSIGTWEIFFILDQFCEKSEETTG